MMIGQMTPHTRSWTQDLFSCWVEKRYHGNQERKGSRRIQHWDWIYNSCKDKQWRHLSAEFTDRIIWKLLLIYLVLLVRGLYDLQEAMPTTKLVSILITGFHIVTEVKW